MCKSSSAMRQTKVVGAGGIGKDAVLERFSFARQAWMGRLCERRAAEAALTIKLLGTCDSLEAAKLCNVWIAKHLELLVADSQVFARHWMNLSKEDSQHSSIDSSAEGESP